MFVALAVLEAAQEVMCRRVVERRQIGHFGVGREMILRVERVVDKEDSASHGRLATKWSRRLIPAQVRVACAGCESVGSYCTSRVAHGPYSVQENFRSSALDRSIP